MKDDKKSEQMVPKMTYSASPDKLELRLKKEILKTDKPWTNFRLVSSLLLLLIPTLVVSFCFAINLLNELTTLLLVAVIAILGLILFVLSRY